VFSVELQPLPSFTVVAISHTSKNSIAATNTHVAAADNMTSGSALHRGLPAMAQHKEREGQARRLMAAERNRYGPPVLWLLGKNLETFLFLVPYPAAMLALGASQHTCRGPSGCLSGSSNADRCSSIALAFHCNKKNTTCSVFTQQQNRETFLLLVPYSSGNVAFGTSQCTCWDP
jgi:hypothetical protein